MKKNILNRYFKTGVCVFFAALCSALLIIGCPTPFNPSGLYTMQEGKGTFTLNISGSQTQSRTIMPSTADNQFARYRMVFEKAGQPDVEIKGDISAIRQPVELTSGTYKLTVYGYTTEVNMNATPHKPAAHATISNLNIVAGAAVSPAISLKAYGVGNHSGTGIFSWDIDYPADVTAKMELLPISPTPGSNVTLNFVSGANPVAKSAERALAAGYYRVVITLEKASMRTVVWRETLHVYENMTSFYPYTFIDDHFIKANFVVTLEYDNGQPSVTSTYFYDELTSLPVNVERSTTGGYGFIRKFDGWFDGATRWTLGSPLTKNTTLKAGWVSILSGTGSTGYSFNTNSLYNIPNAVRGWWSQTIQGRWLTGVMIETGVGAPLEVPPIAQEFVFSTIPAGGFSGTIPGGWGTWTAIPHNGQKAPGTTRFIDVPATYGAESLPTPARNADGYPNLVAFPIGHTKAGQPLDIVYRHNYDATLYGGGQPNGVTTASANGLRFSINANIPIQGFEASIMSAFSTTAGTGRTATRTRDEAKIYMVDSQNPNTVQDYITPLEVLNAGVYSPFSFESLGNVTNMTGGLTATGTGNPPGHNNLAAWSGWFTVRGANVTAASLAFDTSDTGKRNASSPGSLRMNWTQTTNATAGNQTARFGYKGLVPFHATHITFWARATNAGAYTVTVRTNNITDQTTANINLTTSWAQYTVALGGTAANRVAIEYIAFQCQRNLNGSFQLWISDIAFIQRYTYLTNTGANATHNTVILSGHGDVTPRRLFNIVLFTSTSHTFTTDKPEWMPYIYPIFERGTGSGASFESGGMYYWREGEREFWNIESEVEPRFRVFESAGKTHEQEGSIVVRNPNGSVGGTWIEDPSGPDVQSTIVPGPTHRVTYGPRDLMYMGDKIGTVTIVSTSETVVGTNITHVSITVTYNIDSSVRGYINNIYCNNSPVTYNSGTGVGTVSLTGLTHGDLNLNTVLNFND